MCYRNIFPQGLPQQFSFICTFRTRKPPKTAWNIIRISDIRSRPQFQVTLNPRKNAIEFGITDFSGKLQTLVFRKAQVSYHILLIRNDQFGTNMFTSLLGV